MNHPRQGIKNIPYICAQLGMKYVIITPGSRNAPLIISFNQEKSIECLSITDERSAAYFALGISQVTGNPVGLVCTSGTAVLNFGPAIAEAFYQYLPLVIFTADRPPELIDQADGQTIRQFEVFKNHVKKSFSLPVETSTDPDLWFSNRIISEAIGIATESPSGPVHINVPLREPLYDKLPELSDNLKVIQSVSTQPEFSESIFEKLLVKWQHIEKKMIVAGFNYYNPDLNRLLGKLSDEKSVVIIAENLSNSANVKFIHSPEKFFAALKENEKEKFRPELLITIGNSVVSKRLKQYLRKFRPAEHWNISTGYEYIDTYQCLTLNLKLNPGKFFEKLLSSGSVTISGKDFAGLYHDKAQVTDKKHDMYMKQAPFSDLKAFEQITYSLPSGTNLHLANSTPVRYAQLFKSREDIEYFGNRGTSGIDGCISTAAGSAYASDKPTVIVAGDLAFIYDSNALWNNHLSGKLKIIVINNGGGNIFTLIETSPEINAVRNFFETPHRVNLKQLTSAFEVKYFFCNDGEGLKTGLNNLFSTKEPAVLEIKTDSKTDTLVFKEYYSHLKK